MLPVDGQQDKKGRLTMGSDKWANDLVQFARLLCEIRATQDELDVDGLCESMDLDPDDIGELFDRANDVWEHAKTVA